MSRWFVHRFLLARGYSGTLLVILLCERSIDCDPNQMLTGGIELTLAGSTVSSEPERMKGNYAGRPIGGVEEIE